MSEMTPEQRKAEVLKSMTPNQRKVVEFVNPKFKQYDKPFMLAVAVQGCVFLCALGLTLFFFLNCPSTGLQPLAILPMQELSVMADDGAFSCVRSTHIIKMVTWCNVGFEKQDDPNDPNNEICVAVGAAAAQAPAVQQAPNAADPNAAAQNPNAADPNAAAQDPNAADPNAAAQDPNAVDPNAADPNAVDPNAVDPNAADPNAVRQLNAAAAAAITQRNLPSELALFGNVNRQLQDAANVPTITAPIMKGCNVPAADIEKYGGYCESDGNPRTNSYASEGSCPGSNDKVDTDNGGDLYAVYYDGKRCRKFDEALGLALAYALYLEVVFTVIWILVFTKTGKLNNLDGSDALTGATDMIADDIEGMKNAQSQKTWSQKDLEKLVFEMLQEDKNGDTSRMDAHNKKMEMKEMVEVFVQGAQGVEAEQEAANQA